MQIYLTHRHSSTLSLKDLSVTAVMYSYIGIEEVACLNQVIRDGQVIQRARSLRLMIMPCRLWSRGDMRVQRVYISNILSKNSQIHSILIQEPRSNSLIDLPKETTPQDNPRLYLSATLSQPSHSSNFDKQSTIESHILIPFLYKFRMCIALGAFAVRKARAAGKKGDYQNARSVPAGGRPVSPISKVPGQSPPQNGAQSGGYTQKSYVAS